VRAMDNLAIRTEQLRRVYKFRPAKGEKKKAVEALASVDLEVKRGELFGLLGPNGAGKTTLIKILTTLLAPTSGRAWVDGLDIEKDLTRIRSRINMVAGGEFTGYGLLTARENLWMFAQFYGLDFKTTRQRIDELLAVVSMTDQANTKISNLSTGMRQKMNFARGFITDPQIVFLDEPTLGLDVGAAREVRRYVKAWTARPEKTTLLTTHYMVEADELCDRVAIIDKGRVLACDTPAALKRQLQREAIFELQVSGVLPPAHREQIGKLPGVHKFTCSQQDGYADLTLILDDESAIGPVVSNLTGNDSSIMTLHKCEPTLEDVFVALVGRTLAEDTSEA
jgi:ABC-2 type transport system ATP-binding protein